MMSQAATAFGMSVTHRVRYCSAGDCQLSGELRKCRRAQSAKDDPSLTSGRMEILHPSFGRNRDTECGIVQGVDQGADARSR
jgi:hypothetical protein